MKHPMRKKIAKGKTKTGAEGQAARRPRIRVSKQDSEKFIDVVTELSCGDQFLVPNPFCRQYLGWSTKRYNAVKSKLVKQGLILVRRASGKIGLVVAPPPATTINYADHLVAFIDLLGFGQLIERSAQDDTNEIARNLATAIEAARRYLSRMTASHEFTLTQFSDSFVVSLKQDVTRRDTMVFGMAIQRIIDQFLSIGLLLRGAIAAGKLIHDKDLLFGPAMNRAYKLEVTRAKVPRIIVDPELSLSEKDLFPLVLARDDDGLLYVDYLNLNKAFYVMPLLWCSIRRILAKMPDTDELREKRDWLVKKYNRAIAGFDLSKFEERLLDRAWEREYIAQNYEEYRAAARSLALI